MRLHIEVEIASFDEQDAETESPLEIASYLLDEKCDDPCFEIVYARWSDG